MGFKIGVISQSQEFIRLICSFFDDSVEPVVSQGYYHQAADVAKEMVEKGVNVIIARERTADLIEKSVPIDVVHCDFAAMDTLTAISKAAPEDFPLACVNEATRGRQPYSIMQLAEKICGQKVEVITYSDSKSLESGLQSAVEKGIHSVIGGRYSTEIAAQFGLRTIEILTNYESAKNAVEKAALIQKTLQYKADRNAMLISAFNTAENIRWRPSRRSRGR
jgi:hypothetical protein